AQSTGVVPARPGSLSLKSQANPPGMAKGATGWSFWLLLCSGFHLLIVGALRRIRIVADGRIGREHFMEPSVRRSHCESNAAQSLIGALISTVVCSAITATRAQAGRLLRLRAIALALRAKQLCDFCGGSLSQLGRTMIETNQITGDGHPWFAVQTRTTHEKRVASLF